MAFEYKPEEYKYVKQERTDTLDKAFDKVVDDLGMNVFAVLAHLEKKAFERVANPDKEWLTFAFGKTAYSHQLDTYCKPNESIDFAHSVVCPDKDADWVNTAKNDRYAFNSHLINLMIEEKEEYFDNLPEQINLNTLKKDVGKSRSLNQGLRKLHGYQKIEKEMNDMKSRIAALEAAQTNSRIDLDLVKMSVECPIVTPKARAKVMRNNGCTIKSIASELGVHRNTIKNWLKED